jgi:C4-dicarboxylate-specific signal transduction histidine kinase
MIYNNRSLKIKPPSLKRGLALPFALASVVAIVAVNFNNYYDLRVENQKAAHARATTLADGISFSAEQLKDRYGIQRIITSYGAQRDIKNLFILEKQSQKVIASIKRQQLGETLDALKTQKNEFEEIEFQNNELKVLSQQSLDKDLWAVVPYKIENTHRENEAKVSEYYVALQMSSAGSYELFLIEVTKDAFILTLILSMLTYYQFWIMKENIVAPLWHLTSVIRRRKEGDKKILSEIYGDSEVGELSGALNEMFLKLEKNEEEALQSQIRLAHSAKMASLGEMAGGVAHEINNPLAVIVGKIGVMRRKAEKGVQSPEELGSDLDKIESMAVRISKIVKGLRSYSRNGDADPFELKSLNKIVEESVELCSEKFKKKNIGLAFNNNVEALVNCRAVELSQVLVNLLNNSFDAVEEQKEKWVRLDVDMVGESSVVVSVTDSGPGIPPEVAARIMQPFYTTKPVGKGTGLGLSISEGIIQSHGGVLRYNPKSPNTQFELVLPCKIVSPKMQGKETA